MLPTVTTNCPSCGESIELVVDDSVSDQQYVEDCFVCCRPINVRLSVDVDGDIQADCRAENEI
jgi:hypothetical protein